MKSFSPSPHHSDEIVENNSDDEPGNDAAQKDRDGRDGGPSAANDGNISFKKTTAPNGQQKHQIMCHTQNQSYHINESFDGGQTLRQDHADDDLPDGERPDPDRDPERGYHPEQPVSINSSIEIISKKKLSSQDVMNGALQHSNI